MRGEGATNGEHCRGIKPGCTCEMEEELTGIAQMVVVNQAQGHVAKVSPECGYWPIIIYNNSIGRDSGVVRLRK